MPRKCLAASSLYLCDRCRMRHRLLQKRRPRTNRVGKKARARSPKRSDGDQTIFGCLPPRNGRGSPQTPGGEAAHFIGQAATPRAAPAWNRVELRRNRPPSSGVRIAKMGWKLNAIGVVVLAIYWKQWQYPARRRRRLASPADPGPRVSSRREALPQSRSRVCLCVPPTLSRSRAAAATPTPRRIARRSTTRRKAARSPSFPSRSSNR